MSISGEHLGRKSSTTSSSSKKLPENMVNLLEASQTSLMSSLTDSQSLLGREYSYISTDMTAEAIQQCERFILHPYSNALKMIGWLPYSYTMAGTVRQWILVLLWSCSILVTMVTQLLTCFKRDAFIPGKNVQETVGLVTLMPINSQLQSAIELAEPVSIFETSDAINGSTITISPVTLVPSLHLITCGSHLISSLLLLDVVLILTYFYGIYIFSRGESEYLFGLASHVFIKNFEAESSSSNLIKTIGVFYICGMCWLVFSLGVRVMTAIAVDLFNSHVFIEWPDFSLGGGVKILLLVVSLFGFFTFDMVYMFSILNYVAQGEMNIYLLWDIRRLIKLRQHDNIDCAIKDVQKCKQYLDVLNGKTASLTSLALFVLGNLTMLTIIDLNNIDKTERAYASGDFQILAGVSSFLNALCWSLLFTLPFVQAARVTYWCERLKDVGTEIRGRVFAVYNDVDLLDLDSFLSFLGAIQMRASIFGVPIYPWLMYLLAVAFSFTMLVLFQLDVYSIARYI